MGAAVQRTFISLRVPNYRRYFAGQVVSISGNWMQNVATMWLMVTLTGSGDLDPHAPTLEGYLFPNTYRLAMMQAVSQAVEAELEKSL